MSLGLNYLLSLNRYLDNILVSPLHRSVMESIGSDSCHKPLPVKTLLILTVSFVETKESSFIDLNANVCTCLLTEIIHCQGQEFSFARVIRIRRLDSIENRCNCVEINATDMSA